MSKPRGIKALRDAVRCLEECQMPQDPNGQVIDLTNYVQKDGTKVLSDINYSVAEKIKLGTLQNTDLSDVNNQLSQHDGRITTDTNNISIINSTINTLKGGSSETVASLKSSIDTLSTSKANISTVTAILNILGIDSSGNSVTDADTIVDTLSEMLVAFQSYAEGTDVATMLSTLSTNISNEISRASNAEGLNSTTITSNTTAINGLTSSLNTLKSGSTETIATLRSSIDTLTSNKADANVITVILSILGIDSAGNTVVDADTVVNTLKEMLTTFQTFSEGSNVATIITNLTNSINNEITRAIGIEATKVGLTGDETITGSKTYTTTQKFTASWSSRQATFGSTGQSGVIGFGRGSDGAVQSKIGYTSATENNAFDISNTSGGGSVNITVVNGTAIKVLFNGNIILQTGGTFTDTGDKLQVNGTAKINGKLTIVSNDIEFSSASNSIVLIDKGNGGKKRIIITNNVIGYENVT